MDVGILIRYGRLVPGREQRAIDLFAEATEYFGELMSEERITFFEPFFLGTSDHEAETGFMFLKGPAPEIFKLVEEERFLELLDKAYYLVEHIRWDLITVGEGVTAQLERSAKVRAELGLA